MKFSTILLVQNKLNCTQNFEFIIKRQQNKN